MFPAYADKDTMADDLLPYIAHLLPKDLVVQKSIFRDDDTRITLYVTEKVPKEKRKYRLQPAHGKWIHVVRHGLGGNLEDYIRWFSQIRGEVCVSETQGDDLLLANKYPLCLMIEGTPTNLFSRDIWSKIDPWSGRRIVPPNAPIGAHRAEGFIIPVNSKVVGVATNSPTYYEQAQKLKQNGDLEFVSGNPEQFSTGADAIIRQSLKDLSVPWPGFGPSLGDENTKPAAVFSITARKEFGGGRKGFLFPEIIEWITSYDGRIPGDPVEPQKEDNPGLWDKDAGIMVVFPDRRPGPPPQSIMLPKPDGSMEPSPIGQYMEITEVKQKLASLLPPTRIPGLGSTKGDRSSPARLRRLVIQQTAQPFALLDDGSVQTTKEGLQRLLLLMANPPELPPHWERDKKASLPFSRRTSLPFSRRTGSTK
jgi:hypothetical protein